MPVVLRFPLMMVVAAVILFQPPRARADDTPTTTKEQNREFIGLAGTTLQALGARRQDVAVKAAEALVELTRAAHFKPSGEKTLLALRYLAAARELNGEPAVARTHYERVLATLESAPAPDRAEIARTLDSIGNTERSEGHFARAETSYLRAYTLRQNQFGVEAVETAQSLERLLYLAWDRHEDAAAAKLEERGLALRERARGPSDPEVADLLLSSAKHEDRAERPAASEPRFRRALSILERASFAQIESRVVRLRILAEDYERQLHDFARAEDLYQLIVAQLERKFGANAPETAGYLLRLGNLAFRRGDVAGARVRFEKGLAIEEQSPSDGLAKSYDRVAIFHDATGSGGRAEELFKKALSLREAKDPDSFDVSFSLHNLGFLYMAGRRFEDGEKMLRRALAIRERTAGPDAIDLSATLNALGVLLARQGNLRDARSALERAVAIQEKHAGREQDELVAATARHLAAVYDGLGLAEQAVTVLARAQNFEEQMIHTNLRAGTDVEKQAFLDSLSDGIGSAVSLHLQRAPGSAAAARLAMEVVLRRKGRVLEVMADDAEALRSHISPELRGRLDELLALQTVLFEARFSRERSPTALEARLRAQDRARELESALRAKSVELRRLQPAVSLASVQREIPANGALVEYVVYWPNHAGIAWDAFEGPRYAAYVLRHDGDPFGVDLGEKHAIDAQVTAFRAALASQADFRALARSLYESLVVPVRSKTQGAQLLLAPDGAITLLPFQALVDERERFLIETQSFTYLTTGGDLLRIALPSPHGTPAVVLANPSFGPRAAPEAGGVEAGGVGLLRRAYFPALPGTADEASALARLLPDATVLVEERASKQALMAVHGPSILHIATHGFFLNSATSPVRPGARQLELVKADGEALSRTPPHNLDDDPMLRSGLALAGANLRRAGQSGILTAREVARLDLWGTRVAVLSACETAVGEARDGQGVYGLRRALVIAGAESQTMSLWKVDDTATRDLMLLYYAGLLAGRGRSDALRDAQLTIMKQPGRGAPYFWAGFIAAGDWRAIPEFDRKPVAVEVAGKHGACACEVRGRTSSGPWFALPLAGVVAVARRRLRPRTLR